MPNQKLNIQSIKLVNLLINLINPRYDPRKNQRAAIATIALDQPFKLFNLAEDIVEKGLNPAELPIVTPLEEDETFRILEGNRRIAALKLISSPSLMKSIGLPDSLSKNYKSLHMISKDTLPDNVTCSVMSPEEARHWIRLKHTGENQGVGVVPWDGLQTQRFRGSSPALQAIELVKGSDYLDEVTRQKLAKISITNLSRILNTSEARKYLGVDIIQGELLPPGEEGIARLAMIISEIANRTIKVTHLDTQEQRIEYAKEVSLRPLPKPVRIITGSDITVSLTSPTTKSGTSVRRISSDRKTLIPLRFKIAIPQQRINKIYDELRKLNVDNFNNCCAVMFRVFIELSVDEFAKRKKISLKSPAKQKTTSTHNSSRKISKKEMYLREKLKTIADYLEQQSICTKPELKGVRTLYTNRNHILSVDTLNAYVHNQDYNPAPIDLKINWDNLQIFVERIWTA